MNADTISTVALAAVAAIGLLFAGAGWLYRRGGSERGLSIAMQDATAAIERLTAAFDGFRSSVIDQLHQHDIRITKLEKDE